MNKINNFILGCQEFDLGNFDKAIKYFTREIEINPNALQAFVKRGEAYYEIEKWDKWSEDLKNQIRIYSNILKNNNCDYFSLNNRGEAYRLLDKNKKAIKDFEKAIELKPDFLDAYIHLGYAKLYGENNYTLEEALEVFKKALSIQSINSQVLYNIGNIYKQIGNYEDAINYFKKSIDVKGDYSWVACRDLAEIYYKEAKYYEAIKYFKILLELYPEFIHIYTRISNAYEKLQKYDKALNYMEIAIKKNNEPYPLYYFAKSKLLAKLEDYENALISIDKAISINKCKPYLQYKGSLLLKLGKLLEAENTFIEINNMWREKCIKLQRICYKNEIDISHIK